jgi:hypothetical protein
MGLTRADEASLEAENLRLAEQVREMSGEALLRREAALSGIPIRGYFGKGHRLPRIEGTASRSRTVRFTLNYPRSGIDDRR